MSMVSLRHAWSMLTRASGPLARSTFTRLSPHVAAWWKPSLHADMTPDHVSMPAWTSRVELTCLKRTLVLVS